VAKAFNSLGALGREMLENAVILLVEDREDDVLIIARAFAEAKLDNEVRVVSDGETAIQYLKGEGQYADREKFPLPQLILLDLKMPKVDGFEVLRWVRQESQFKNVIVVVLTSSNAIRDVNLAYQLGANSFMVKPDDFQNVTAMAKFLRDYWLFGNRAREVKPAPPPKPG